MSFPDFLKSHPVISIGSVVVLLAFLGALSMVFSQGTFVDDNGCSYTPLNNPNGGNFTSIDQVESFFEENNQEIPSELLLEERDGVVYHSVRGECGTVGGGN